MAPDTAARLALRRAVVALSLIALFAVLMGLVLFAGWAIEQAIRAGGGA